MTDDVIFKFFFFKSQFFTLFFCTGGMNVQSLNFFRPHEIESNYYTKIYFFRHKVSIYVIYNNDYIKVIYLFFFWVFFWKNLYGSDWYLITIEFQITNEFSNVCVSSFIWRRVQFYTVWTTFIHLQSVHMYA